VQPFGDQPAGSKSDVIVQTRGPEATSAPGPGIQQLERSATFISETIRSQLESDRPFEAQIGDTPRDAQRVPLVRQRLGLLLGQSRRYSVELEIAEPHVPHSPGGVQCLSEYAVVLGESEGSRNPVADTPRAPEQVRLVEPFEMLRKG
jgi:hypothetical protein